MTDHSAAVPLRALAIALGVGCAAPALAAPLTGSGANLPIPSPNPGEPPRQGAALSGITAAGFTGTWTAPVLPGWIGSFSATGPVPASNLYPAGTTRYDFTTLAAGELPVGTYFSFGDVDGGSVTNETFVLQAFDATGGLLTNPWLDEAFAVTGVGTGSGGAFLPGNMPGWEWDAGTSTYTIDGTTVTGGNPSLAVWMENNTAMSYLSVVRTSNFANFGLSAPVPAPAGVGVLALAGYLATRRRR